MSKSPHARPDRNTRRKTPGRDTFEIDVFRPGTFTPMAGGSVAYSAGDLIAIAEAYDPEAAPAPIVVGHPKDDTPAFGWIEGFRFDGERERLVATVGDVVPEFADAVAAKRYRKVSMSFFRPDATNNPRPGAWYPKHLGFLGGAAPAVSGLKPVELAGDGDEAETFEFGEAGFRDSASLFRRMRDFMIDQFGLERADEVLPAYEIEWLERRADAEPTASYSQPSNQDEEPDVTKTPKPDDDANFAERNAELERREQRLAKREAEALSAEHASFCEELIEQGRLLPANKQCAVGLLDALAAGEMEALQFSENGEGVEKRPVEALKALLSSQPKTVAFGEAELGDDVAEDDPDDRDPADIARRAVAFQSNQARDGISISTEEAVEHVLKGEAA